MGTVFQFPPWREYYNPLRGLTLDRILAMEAAADRGQYADLQWFWRHMEPADVTVTAAITRRLAFLRSLTWQVKTIEGADPTLAAEQAAALTDAYNRIENFADATRFLAGAIFRGYAHVEKAQNPQGEIVRLDPIEQVFWVRNRGKWEFNADTRSEQTKGETVDPAAVIVHEQAPAHRGIHRHFFSKTLALADWDADLAAGAVANIFIIAPPGTGEDKMREFSDVAERVASNGRGALPNGTQVNRFAPADGRGQTPYQTRIDYCDRQMVMAATGGILTMLAESGSGTLAGGAHAATMLDISRADAAALTQTYQTAIDAPLLQGKFQGQKSAAYFAFDLPNQMDPAALLAVVGNLSWAGLTVAPEQLAEVTGKRGQVDSSSSQGTCPLLVPPCVPCLDAATTIQGLLVILVILTSMYYIRLVNTVITSKGQITIPASIRRRLHLRPGDRLAFDPSAPFVKAVKAFDVAKMKSAIGCCREKATEYSAQTWLDETRGPVELPPEDGHAHRG